MAAGCWTVLVGMTRGLGGMLAAAVDLALPQSCPACGGPAAPGRMRDGTDWCAAGCGRPLRCPPRRVALAQEALDSAVGQRVPPVRAICRYAEGVREAIVAGKDRGRADLPPQLGLALAGALRRGRPEQLWLVPAPSRRSAARARGGDPVLAMAVAAARELAAGGIPAGVAPCLHTTGRARDSVGLGPADRVRNLFGRIAFDPAGAPEPGASVVLVDDVVTSGATLLAACATLHAAGVTVRQALAVAAAAPWLLSGWPSRSGEKSTHRPTTGGR